MTSTEIAALSDEEQDELTFDEMPRCSSSCTVTETWEFGDVENGELVPGRKALLVRRTTHAQDCDWVSLRGKTETRVLDREILWEPRSF